MSASDSRKLRRLIRVMRFSGGSDAAIERLAEVRRGRISGAAIVGGSSAVIALRPPEPGDERESGGWLTLETDAREIRWGDRVGVRTRKVDAASGIHLRP